MKFFLFFLLTCFLLGFALPKQPLPRLSWILGGICLFVAFGYFSLGMI
jgi:hypothetical protein